MTDFVSGKAALMGTELKQLLLEKGLSKTLRIMKLTAVFLLLAALQVSAKGIAQDKISLSVSNASLEKVFGQIEAQTGFVFIYKDETVKDKKVSIQVTNVTLTQALDECLKGQALSYQIVGKSVAIKANKKDTDQIGGVATGTPPFIDVRGRVVNEKGEPVEGVTVMVKGNSKKTLTDKNGEFSLATVEQDATLLFTHITMESFEVKVSGKTELVINLRTKVSALGDVVVTVNTGYQQIPKERATGSFEFLGKTELNSRVGTDILSRLEGVSSTIMFDRRDLSTSQNKVSANNINIRGISTLTEGMKAPLIVINNFPYEGDINNINPNDVENITILKDAAAASIWGARAANGVIVITTKQGKYNQTNKITFNTNIGITEKPDLFKYPKISSTDFIDMEKYLFSEGFYDDELGDKRNFPSVSPVVEILTKQKSGMISQADATSQIDALRTVDVRNDFDKYIYQKAVNQQYYLNLNGGSEKLRYSFSTGFDKNKNSLTGNDYQRGNFRSDNYLSLTRKLELNMGIAYTNSTEKLNSLGEIGSQAYNYDYYNERKLYPYAQFSDEDGTHLSVAKNYRSSYTDTAGGGRLMDWKFRPLDEITNANNSSKLQDLIFNIGANLKINEALSAQATYQYQHTNGLSETVYNEQTYYARNLVNLFTSLQGNNIGYNLPKGGILQQNNFGVTSHVGRSQLNFNKTWYKHQLVAIGGGEIREKMQTQDVYRVYGYNSNNLSLGAVDYVNFYQQYGNRGLTKIPQIVSFYKATDRFVSLFANAAYTYHNRYMLSGSVRRDASNVFGADLNDKWSPFWTIGGGWIISNEPFFKLNSVPYLKLRANYGYQGNVNNSLAPYTIISYLSAASNPLVNVPFASIAVPGNPGLSWESTRQLNIGLDFQLLKNRISGSVDVYNKESENLIWTSALDPTTGLTGVKRNSANLEGNGLEIVLNTTNINTRNFKWKTMIGINHVINKVTDYFLDDKTRRAENIVGYGNTIAAVKGKSPYGIFSYPFAGLDSATGNPLGYLGKSTSTNYRAIFQQLYDTSNLVYHGSGIPTVFGVFNNTFTYKQLSLGVSISYSLGYYVRKSTVRYYDLFWKGNMHVDFNQRWQKPGDEKNTTIPSMAYPQFNTRRDDFYSNATPNVLKGDNIRLQNIRLSYDLNKSLLNKLPISGIQIYALAQNLGILWRANKEGLDPDYDVNLAPYPRPRTFAVGATLSL